MKKLSLFQLTWPIFIETLLIMMLGFVDVFVLSKIDENAAAAVGTANQVIANFTLLFLIISGSSAILISQSLGAGNRKRASGIAALSIVFNLAVGLIISVILSLFSRDILAFIGAEGTLLDYADSYLSVVGSFLFFQALLGACGVIIRANGNTKFPMLATLGINIIHIFLDIIFVFGLLGLPKMGITSVAYATSVSRFLGMVAVLIYVFKKTESLRIFKLLKPFPIKDALNMLKVGVPSAFETFNYNLSQLVVTSFALKALTPSEYNAKTFVQSIAVFFYVLSLSLGQGSQIIVGHLVGNMDFDRAYKTGFKALRLAYMASAVLCGIGILLRSQLLSVFTDNKEIIAIGGTLLILNFFVEMGRTSNLVLINDLKGAGDVYFPTIAAIFSMWIISTGGAYLLAVAFGMGIKGMWIAFACDECVRGILMIWRWKSGIWRKKRLA